MRYKRVGKQYEHRKVWEEVHGPIPKGMHIHHINSNKLDNRIENLTLLSHADNIRRDNWGEGYQTKKNLTRPYAARRRLDGKVTYLGYFGTPCGAVMATRMAYVNT